MDKKFSFEVLDKTKKATLQAGEIIKQHWDQPKDIQYKGRINLVTSTDVTVEEFLKTELERILPEANFLAEETADGNQLGNFTWIVDPLDGTTNFAHGLSSVAVSVALWEKDQIVLGLIYLPILREMFFAIEGQGAFLNDQSIYVSTQTSLENSLIATGFPYNIKERINEVVPILQNVLTTCRGVRRMGAAAIDLAYTACGRFEGFYELGLKPWDTAAGWLLLQEAGGTVTKFNPANPYFLTSDSILATNTHIHQELGNILAYNT